MKHGALIRQVQTHSDSSVKQQTADSHRLVDAETMHAQLHGVSLLKQCWSACIYVSIDPAKSTSNASKIVWKTPCTSTFGLHHPCSPSQHLRRAAADAATQSMHGHLCYIAAAAYFDPGYLLHGVACHACHIICSAQQLMAFCPQFDNDCNIRSDYVA